MNIAIIPARCGSKRVPGKNSRLLKGKPLIVWTIEAALSAKIFDAVLVSTDSEEIADIALNAGALVPFLRPKSISTDSSTTNDVIVHAIDWFECNVGGVNVVTLLQPTSPLRTGDNIKSAFELYLSKCAKSVISVCEVEHPIQLCNQLPDDLSMDKFIVSENLKRSQDYDKYYRLNGAIYIFDRCYVGVLDKIYSDNSFAFVMKRDESIDIDEEIDFVIAEAILCKHE